MGLLVLVGCSSQAGSTTGSTELTANEPRVSVPSASTGKTVAGLDQLGIDLWHVAAGDGAANVVVSPLSLGLAFSMARDGVTAGGSGLDEVLHFPVTGRDAAFDRLSSGLVTTSVPPSPSAAASSPDPNAAPPPPIVAIANALFVQHGTPVVRSFLTTLARYYGAGVRTVDFTRPSASQALNAWVQAQTAGRISKLFDVLDPTTKLVLANAIYLKAAWLYQFEASATRPEPFTTADGREVRIPAMTEQENLPYARGPGWQAIELPYVGGSLAMRVLLPDPGRTLADTLTTATLHSLPSLLQTADVKLVMPRWRADTSLDPLALPGLAAAATAADFGGIAPGLVLTAAVHKAVITVDEQGTEAAAVTGLSFTSGAEIVRQQVTFTVNRPFAYEIVDTATQAPLFLGSTADPSHA